MRGIFRGILRTKLCRLCWIILLVVLGTVSLVLWRKALIDGAVELIIPEDRSSTNTDSFGGLEIAIFPEVPRVSEGDIAQLTCVSPGSSILDFIPPASLSPTLLSSVHTNLLPGGAVLIVEDVTLAHSGVYTCKAIGPDGQQLQLSVSLTVEKRDLEEVEVSSPSSSSPSSSSSSTSSSLATSSSPSSSSSTTTSSSSSSLTTSSSPSIQLIKATHKETSSIYNISRPTISAKRLLHHSAGSELKGQRMKRTIVQKEEEELGEVAVEEVKEEVKNVKVERARRFGEAADLGTYQRSAVDEFCSRHYSSAASRQSHPFAYAHHTLLDHRHRVLFCFLPKVGCTNLKLLFFVRQGYIRPSEMNKERDEIDQDRLLSIVRRASLETYKKRMSTRKIDTTLGSYFKYVMIRNPLERLASGYRSKIERYNMTGLLRDEPHYNWARKAIFRNIHPEEYRKWVLTERRNKSIQISFSDFITFWLNPTSLDFKFDDHFTTFLNICQPCRTKFDFYGNFNHFDRDAQVLMDKIGARRSDLRQGYYSDEGAVATNQKMRAYYSTLSDSQKKDILRKMALELEFHYTIFPEERDSHKQILGIDIDLPLPP